MTAPPLSRARITTCILINLAATPGLGSIFARRKVAGTFQLVLALAGFCLLMAWMVRTVFSMVSQQVDGTRSAPTPPWMWKWGLILFIAGWLWSLFTSVSLWRESQPDPVPPKLS